jgi:hypothetical protein
MTADGRIPMTCPACGKAGSVRARSAGRPVRCAGCGTMIRVYRPGEEPEAPKPPVPAPTAAAPSPEAEVTDLAPLPDRGPKSIPNSRLMTAVSVACGAAGAAFLLTPFGMCLAAPVAAFGFVLAGFAAGNGRDRWALLGLALCGLVVLAAIGVSVANQADSARSLRQLQQQLQLLP